MNDIIAADRKRYLRQKRNVSAHTLACSVIATILLALTIGGVVYFKMDERNATLVEYNRILTELYNVSLQPAEYPRYMAL